MTINNMNNDNQNVLVCDREYMKSIIVNPDICYEVLEEVKMISLDSQFAKWQSLVDIQDSVVGIALNVLPEIKFEVEQAIIEVIKKKTEVKQDLIVDITEFLSLCEFYCNGSTQLQDLYFQFQKQFLPYSQELVEKMLKLASISRPSTINEVSSQSKTPSTSTGRRGKK